ncbi:Uncharacterized protein APZ42_034182 [Daphnia magna]|uniref:Uncharacterized protein n=1 Tax=Daphnia magna TaxID=35525 RepID=A0A164KCZ9_9CRUS|nr:Uncharacterized protein APZ42_034182 [Daphnia magna]
MARAFDKARAGRGFFDGGGLLLNWLFGTATTKDLESKQSRIESQRQERSGGGTPSPGAGDPVKCDHGAPSGAKVTRSVEKANRVRDWKADVLHGCQTGLADAAIGRLSPLLCPPNVLAKAPNSVRQALLQGWGLTPALQGGNRWRGQGGRQRSFVHSSAATSNEESVSHSYAGLAPYLGVSLDQQLFVEFNVDEVRKCAPYMGSVCPFLKPIDRKGRIKSCAASVFLQEQEGIQRNCHLDIKKRTGIDLIYIGERKWGYAGKDNVTIVLQSPGKRIGGIGLPQVLPAVGVIKIPWLCSATSDEWVLQASFRQKMPVNVTSVIDEKAAGMLSGLLVPMVEQSQPVTKSPIMEEVPAALRTLSRIDLAGTSSHVKAVERLQRQWEEEENSKRFPFEWWIGCLFPLPMLVYLWIEYRRLSSHVDTLLLARFVEVREPGEKDQGQPGQNVVV